MNFDEYMCSFETKNDKKNSNILFKPQFLMHPIYILFNICVIKCSYM
jgi:hypothetical protein